MKIQKVDAAAHHVDWAIRLLVDHGECLPAITLAGAADEVLGRAVASRSAFETLKKSIAVEFAIAEAVVSQQHLNRVRNWLKHWQEYPNDEYIDVEPEEEAVGYISRAISNLLALDRSLPSEATRYFAWLDRHPKFGPLRENTKQVLDELARAER